MKNRFVLSLAGRGKGRIYVVTEVVDANYVLISDGKQRKQSNPKRKKLKHLRLLDGTANTPCSDKELREQISAYEQQPAETPDVNLS